MDTQQIIIIAVVLIVVPPIIVWLRRKLGIGKKKINIIVSCPHCGADIGLERLRNYICGNCNNTVAFFNLATGEPHEDARFYHCSQCGETNFEGVKACLQCGTPR